MPERSGPRGDRDFAQHRLEIQQGWSVYLITKVTPKNVFGIHTMRVGPPNDPPAVDDEEEQSADDISSLDEIYLLGRAKDDKERLIEPANLIRNETGAFLDVADAVQLAVAARGQEPERHLLPGPHFRLVRDFVAPALAAHAGTLDESDDDDDDDEDKDESDDDDDDGEAPMGRGAPRSCRRR